MSGRKFSVVANNIIWIGLLIVLLTFLVAAAWYFISSVDLSGAADGKPAASKRDKNMVVIAGRQEPAGLNPYTCNAYSTALLGDIIYSGLVTYDDKGLAVADVALDVPTLANGGLSADGATVTYRLRPGIKWTDGKELSSNDVLATWRFIMSSKKAISRKGYERIQSIETPDAGTVVLHFGKYYSEYGTLFPVILPAHILSANPDALERTPVGTGPYKLTEWLLGDCLMLTANDDYFGGKPKIKDMKYKFIGENELLLAQLKSGEMDLAADVNLQLLGVVKDIKGYDVKLQPTLALERLDINCQNTILSDSKVRQALALTIDKQHICDTILSGAGTSTASYVAPFSTLHNAAIVSERNLPAARKLLEQNGWMVGSDAVYAKNGVRLEASIMLDSDNALRTVLAENIASSFRDLGVDVKLVKLPGKDVFAALRAGKYQVALYTMMMYPDYAPSALWSSGAIPADKNGNYGLNYPRCLDIRIDTLLAGAATPQSEAKLSSDMQTLQKYLAEDMPTVPLYYYQSVNVMRKELKNFAPGLLGVAAYRNAHLWEW